MEPSNLSQAELLRRYLDGSITEPDADRLFAWIKENSIEDVAEFEAILKAFYDQSFREPSQISSAESQGMLDKLLNSINRQAEKQDVPVRQINNSWWWAAAAVVVLATGSYFLFFNKPAPVIETQVVRYKNDVKPGGNKAILTLGNGKTIILDSAQNGTLAQQGNAKIIKLNNGQLAYNTLHGKLTEIVYNTLATPKGGQYELELPDGSLVWLNAASSIKYPTTFTGKERNVEITGEAYFEVSKDKSKPFHVKVNDMEVEVLGTHFNINSYSDESAVKTTLLEGSVKVTKNTTVVAASSDRQPQSVILTPGQQAQSDRQQQIKIVKDVDLDQVMAWKNGIFNFNGSDLQAAMRQLGRWYDIKVEYEGSLPHIIFKGEMYRNVNLSDVLEGFQKMGVKFRLEKGKLVVTG